MSYICEGSFEPGGREFESLRARQKTKGYINFGVTLLSLGSTVGSNSYFFAAISVTSAPRLLNKPQNAAEPCPSNQGNPNFANASARLGDTATFAAQLLSENLILAVWQSEPLRLIVLVADQHREAKGLHLWHQLLRQ